MGAILDLAEPTVEVRIKLIDALLRLCSTRKVLLGETRHIEDHQQADLATDGSSLWTSGKPSMARSVQRITDVHGGLTWYHTVSQKDVLRHKWLREHMYSCTPPPQLLTFFRLTGWR